MPAWILLGILALIALAAIVLFTAMFMEMRTKRKTGTMQGKKASAVGSALASGKSRATKKQRKKK